MSYKVLITPSNVEFEVKDNADSLLTAGLLANLNLPHGCKSGSCGACKAKVVSGEIAADTVNSILTSEEIAQSKILLCKTAAKSDLVLEIPDFVPGFPIKVLPSKIEELVKDGSVAILKLKLPANQKFEFYAGQYIDILYNGNNRSYSIANALNNDNLLELHIRYRPGGLLSEAVWNEFKVGQILRFKGPLGSFKLKNSMQPILMVATGTGFAPIKAILEDMVNNNNSRKVHLIWGNYTNEDFYALTELKKISTSLNFKLDLCINEGEIPGFYTGLVTDLVLRDYAELSTYEVYACGNPMMIESLFKQATTQQNLRAENFFSDVFTPSA